MERVVEVLVNYFIIFAPFVIAGFVLLYIFRFENPFKNRFSSIFKLLVLYSGFSALASIIWPLFLDFLMTNSIGGAGGWLFLAYLIRFPMFVGVGFVVYLTVSYIMHLMYRRYQN